MGPDSVLMISDFVGSVPKPEKPETEAFLPNRFEPETEASKVGSENRRKNGKMYEIFLKIGIFLHKIVQDTLRDGAIRSKSTIFPNRTEPETEAFFERSKK